MSVLSSMAVMISLPLSEDRIGGRDAAFQVGTMLVTAAATMLTPTAIAAPRPSPPSTRRSVRTRPLARATPVRRRQRGTGDSAPRTAAIDGFDEQGRHHGLARHAVGAEHAEFAGAVGDSPGGRDRDLDDTDEKHRDRDQHDGTADLVGVSQRRGLGADAVGHAEDDHDEECPRGGGDDGQAPSRRSVAARTPSRRTTPFRDHQRSPRSSTGRC